MRAAGPPTAGGGALALLGLLGLALAALLASPAAAWPLVVTLVIAPVLEEVVFRAGLHDALLHRGVSPGQANVGTALAFAGAHLLLLGASAAHALVVVPALLIGAAYNRWRRVRICIALHMGMNALWLAAQHL